MKIKNGLWVTCKKNGEVWSNFSGIWKQETNDELIKICKDASSIMKKKISDSEKHELINEYIKAYDDAQNPEEKASIEKTNKQTLTDICSELINFFKDFEFEPNFRFINTLKKNSDSIESARAYICNYFDLTDNSYKNDVAEKCKSSEFSNMIKKLQSINTLSTINKRFKVYYGSQGTGKTTQAMKETSNVVMVCHSAMLPSDLMEDFKFEDGKPGFKKSMLWQAMEDGTKITLDEINLLPFESLRFLQSILDNKTQIDYKGQVINIKEGFQIIGTMNLTVNGNTFNLPEPLVDRACELKNYKLTSEQLIGALM